MAKCSYAMVHTTLSITCLCRCLHLSMSLPGLLSHAGTVRSLPQKQEEGLEAGLFMYCQKYSSLQSYYIPKM